MRAAYGSELVWIMVWLSGCASPAPSKLNYAVTRIDSALRADVMAAAKMAVQEHFRIAEADSAAGVIRSQPIESRESQPVGRLGDVVGAPRRVRRVAEVRVEEAGTAVRVFCKVEVQQFETDEQRLFMRDMAAVDSPTDTPAQQEAATLPEQNATWHTRARDRSMERQILQAIVERVGAGTSG